MKLLLYGDGGAFASFTARLRLLISRAENDPQPEIIAQLSQEVYANDILQLLVLHIWRFEFEVRGAGAGLAVRGAKQLAREHRRERTYRRSSTTCYDGRLGVAGRRWST